MAGLPISRSPQFLALKAQVEQAAAAALNFFGAPFTRPGLTGALSPAERFDKIDIREFRATGESYALDYAKMMNRALVWSAGSDGRPVGASGGVWDLFERVKFVSGARYMQNPDALLMRRCNSGGITGVIGQDNYAVPLEDVEIIGMRLMQPNFLLNPTMSYSGHFFSMWVNKMLLKGLRIEQFGRGVAVVPRGNDWDAVGTRVYNPIEGDSTTEATGGIRMQAGERQRWIDSIVYSGGDAPLQFAPPATRSTDTVPDGDCIDCVFDGFEAHAGEIARNLLMAPSYQGAGAPVPQGSMIRCGWRNGTVVGGRFGAVIFNRDSTGRIEDPFMENVYCEGPPGGADTTDPDIELERRGIQIINRAGGVVGSRLVNVKTVGFFRENLILDGLDKVTITRCEFGAPTATGFSTARISGCTNVVIDGATDIAAAPASSSLRITGGSVRSAARVQAAAGQFAVALAGNAAVKMDGGAVSGPAGAFGVTVGGTSTADISRTDFSGIVTGALADQITVGGSAGYKVGVGNIGLFASTFVIDAALTADVVLTTAGVYQTVLSGTTTRGLRGGTQRLQAFVQMSTAAVAPDILARLLINGVVVATDEITFRATAKGKLTLSRSLNLAATIAPQTWELQVQQITAGALSTVRGGATRDTVRTSITLEDVA